MQHRTVINGGKDTLKAVSEHWKKEHYDIHWSEDASDRQAVKLAKQILEEEMKSGPVKPDPRNIHH